MAIDYVDVEIVNDDNSSSHITFTKVPGGLDTTALAFGPEEARQAIRFLVNAFGEEVLREYSKLI